MYPVFIPGTIKQTGGGSKVFQKLRPAKVHDASHPNTAVAGAGKYLSRRHLHPVSSRFCFLYRYFQLGAFFQEYHSVLKAGSI